MATVKCDGVAVGSPVEIVLKQGWLLQIDKQTTPVSYTIYHGKKSMSFHSETMGDLCNRRYGVRLSRGRRQMKLPAGVLDSLVEYGPVIQWIDNSSQIMAPPSIKKTSEQPIRGEEEKKSTDDDL